MGISPERFRRIFASLPTAVAVVTAKDTDGLPRGITTNTVTAVSQEPPMLSVCLDRGSVTLTAIRGHGFFAVNFLADGAAVLSQVFAGKGADKFAGTTHLAARSAGGSPIFAEDVVAYAECSVHQEIVMGDHSIIIGVVQDGGTEERPPLMYYRREYTAWRHHEAARR